MPEEKQTSNYPMQFRHQLRPSAQAQQAKPSSLIAQRLLHLITESKVAAHGSYPY